MEGDVSLSLSDCRSVPGKEDDEHSTSTTVNTKHAEWRQWCPAHLLLDDHDLFRWDVLKGEHKTPVEIALPIHGAVVYISLLRLIFTTEPTGWRRGSERGQIESQTEKGRAEQNYQISF